VDTLRVTVALLAIALATGCGSGASTEQASPSFSSNEPAPLDRVSNRGTPFSAPVNDRLANRLQATGLGRALENISLLATRGERAYYRIGEQCYAVGRASSAKFVPGAIACSPQFPTNRPILDFTVFGSTAGPDERPQSQNMAEASVRDNVYSFDPAPAGNALSQVAYSAAGEVVYSTPRR
jgi:hypothetical protein